MCCFDDETASVIGQILKAILPCRYESTLPYPLIPELVRNPKNTKLPNELAKKNTKLQNEIPVLPTFPPPHQIPRSILIRRGGSKGHHAHRRVRLRRTHPPLERPVRPRRDLSAFGGCHQPPRSSHVAEAFQPRYASGVAPASANLPKYSPPASRARSVCG